MKKKCDYCGSYSENGKEVCFYNPRYICLNDLYSLVGEGILCVPTLSECGELGFVKVNNGA